MPGPPLTDPFAIAELDQMLYEVFSGSFSVRPEELPMEMEVGHHASLSLNNRISIIGAMRS